MSLRLGPIALCFIASAANAQPKHIPAYPLVGDTAGQRMGFSLGRAGDFNKDGFDDFIVGIPFVGTGIIRICSGLDGTTLLQKPGARQDDGFGYSVSGLGDVDGDGYQDFIVGAWQDHFYTNVAGCAWIYSGREFVLLYVARGDSTGDRFGVSVKGIGDINRDGYDDFIVGAHMDDNTGIDSGSARVNSGLNNVTLFTFNGDSAGDHFGISVSGAGDVNGDGYPDIIVGAPDADGNGIDAGIARVFSGLDGAVLYTFHGSAAGESFGATVCDAGDANGDGFGDFIVGAPNNDDNGADSGSAQLFSGLDGSVLYTWLGHSAGDRFGTSVSNAGDANGDGVSDVIVGSLHDYVHGSDSGSARVLSGLDGSVLSEFLGNAASQGFGTAVSGAGDMNGDGIDDLVVGAYLSDLRGVDSGGVFAFLSQTPFPSRCPGNANEDSSVDFGDITDIISNWTAPCPSPVKHMRSYPLVGDASFFQFGNSVCDAGDVNGDGIPDFIVGASGANSKRGIARVFSGIDGAVLYTFNGESAGDEFGASSSGAGDVNNDGFDDLIVGAAADDNNGANSGSAFVFSGANGALLYKFDGDKANDYFGGSVSRAGDINNDGFADFIVGAKLNDDNGLSAGLARAYSGVDGSVLYTFRGQNPGDYLGTSVGAAGDVNNDGYPDLIVGAALNSQNGDLSGSAYVFSGKDGAVLHSFYGTAADDNFGYSVDAAGDVNNDGFADLIVGEPLSDFNDLNAGSAYVFSGADGSVIYTFRGDTFQDHLGISVSGAGDVNGDGYPDLIVGMYGYDDPIRDSGGARVYSGRDGSVLYTFSGETFSEYFGISVSGAGDVNGDGYDDLVVGAQRANSNGGGAGRVRVFYSVPAPRCLGNANGDSVVNFEDICAVISNWLNICP